MNGLQRISSVLEGQWTDRRPVMLHNFMMAAKEEGLSMKEFREDPSRAARAFINAAEKYDLDGIVIDIDTATLAAAVGVPVDYPEHEPARTSGAMIQSLDEVNNLQASDLEYNDRVQRWMEVCRIVKSYFGTEKFIRGNCDQAPFSLSSMIRGTQEWMMDLVSYNENVYSLLEYTTKICRQFIRLIAQTGVDMISNGDSVAGPAMISPDLYREYAFPYEKKMVETSHELQLPYALHICGNTDLILKDMVGLGADAIEMDYLTDIELIFRLCHKKTVMIGNIDPSGVLQFGSSELVCNKVRELLKVYGTSPRLIINAGCAIPPDTPPENIRSLITAVRSDKIKYLLE